MPEHTYDQQPTTDVTLRTDRTRELRIECYMNRAGQYPFPALTIGYGFSLYPTLEQLAQIRDTISAFLREQGK